MAQYWGDLLFCNERTSLSNLYIYALNDNWDEIVKREGLERADGDDDSTLNALSSTQTPIWERAVAEAKRTGRCPRIAAMRANKPTQKWMARAAAERSSVNHEDRPLSLETVALFIARAKPKALSPNGIALQQDTLAQLVRGGLPRDPIIRAFQQHETETAARAACREAHDCAAGDTDE